MSGPPKDVPARALWLKLRETPRPSEVVDFPRKGLDGLPVGRVRIQVLTQEEQDRARLIAHDVLRKKHGLSEEAINSSVIQDGVYADAVAREVLAMAVVSESPIPGTEDNATPTYAREFTDGNEIAKVLFSDELAILFNAYVVTQHKFGPTENSVRTSEEVTAWVQRLREGGAAYPLLSLSWQALADLAMSLGERSWSLSTILESQFSSLPSSIQSQLETLGIGSGYFGELPKSAYVSMDADDIDTMEVAKNLVEVTRR
jgi:hypothetical protein